MSHHPELFDSSNWQMDPNIDPQLQHHLSMISQFLLHTQQKQQQPQPETLEPASTSWQTNPNPSSNTQTQSQSQQQPIQYQFIQEHPEVQEVQMPQTAGASACSATAKAKAEAALKFRWCPEYLSQLLHSRRPANLPSPIPYDGTTNLQDVPVEQLVPEFTTVNVVGPDGEMIEVKIGSRRPVVEQQQQQQPLQATLRGIGMEVPFKVSITDADGTRRDDLEWKARWKEALEK